jgi:hypothetical protein
MALSVSGELASEGVPLAILADENLDAILALGGLSLDGRSRLASGLLSGHLSGDGGDCVVQALPEIGLPLVGAGEKNCLEDDFGLDGLRGLYVGSDELVCDSVVCHVRTISYQV